MVTKELRTLKFPSSEQVYEIVDTKARSKADSAEALSNTRQEKLYSGINIKTINGQSIIGEGDLPIVSGGMTPAGVANSAEILAFKEDYGLYIGMDTGFWYCWQASTFNYIAGGEYIQNVQYVNTQVETNRILMEANTLKIDQNTKDIAVNALAIKNKKDYVVSEIEPNNTVFKMWYQTDLT